MSSILTTVSTRTTATFTKYSLMLFFKETPTPADSSQSHRITELEKEQQGLKAKLELTNQLLTQYKASLDRSDRAIETLELQLRTQQELILVLSISVYFLISKCSFLRTTESHPQFQ